MFKNLSIEFFVNRVSGFNTNPNFDLQSVGGEQAPDGVDDFNDGADYQDGDAITYQSQFPEVGDMYIFPAWLKHYVSPFKSDCTRISVSGNIHDSVSFANLQKKVDIKK